MRRVMVLVGGRSNERAVSLKTGAAIARALAGLGEEVRLLDTGRPERPALPPEEFEAATGAEAESEAASGAGTARTAVAAGGAATEAEAVTAAAGTVALTRSLGEAWRPDLVFVALHGGAGEDGTVQALLDWLGLPYTGCAMAASALAMDKMRSKRVFRDGGLLVPEGFLHHAPAGARDRGDAVRGLQARIEIELGYPAVAKPNREGSSVGLAILGDVAAAERLLPGVLAVSGEILVERYVPGREITATILGGRVLPLVEILPDGGLYDYEHKYTRGVTRYACPADLPADLAEGIANDARRAWDLLGCRHLARVDFRLDPEGRSFILEVNTIPGMTETSLVPMAAEAAGLDFPALVAELCRLALEDAP